MSEIISADCHLDFWYLPGDLFYSEAPASWKARMPRVESADSGAAWVHKGKIIRYVGDVGLGRDNVRHDRVTMSVRLRRKARTGIYSDAAKGVFRPASPELRRKVQELDGVVTEVNQFKIANGVEPRSRPKGMFNPLGNPSNFVPTASCGKH